MTATTTKPSYTVYVVSGSKKYDITSALISLDRYEAVSQIAQRVKLELANFLVEGTHLSSVLKARDRVFVYANDGTESKEVFRGYIWERTYKSTGNERTLRITAYDNLIYFQESEDSLYFTAGKSTQDIMSSICSKWGVQLSYSYSSNTHEKLPLRGKLYDIFTADLLDPVKKRTGKKYVILSDQDTMYVKPVGANTKTYKLLAGSNVVGAASGWTMEGIITKIVILGKVGEDDREPVEATVSGDTGTYGTLQKIQSRDENTSLEDAKKEAQNTINEVGKPKWAYEITATDIPWIRKGDKVYVDAGDIVGKNLIVTEVDRTADKKTRQMTLTMEDM